MKIERPLWEALPDIEADSWTVALNRWFQEKVEPINKMLDEAAVVYGNGIKNVWSEGQLGHDTHKALLIQIEPIKKETAEDVLRYILKTYGKEHPDNQDDWRERAKAVLADA